MLADGSLVNLRDSIESNCKILTRFNSGNDRQVAYQRIKHKVCKDYFRQSTRDCKFMFNVFAAIVFAN